AGVRRSAHRRGALSQGGTALPARLGRTTLQPDALGGHAARRPLRGHGAARTVRRRLADLLPDGALNPVSAIRSARHQRRTAAASVGPSVSRLLHRSRAVLYAPDAGKQGCNEVAVAQLARRVDRLRRRRRFASIIQPGGKAEQHAGVRRIFVSRECARWLLLPPGGAHPARRARGDYRAAYGRDWTGPIDRGVPCDRRRPLWHPCLGPWPHPAI